jgi:hypothetical protein
MLLHTLVEVYYEDKDFFSLTYCLDCDVPWDSFYEKKFWNLLWRNCLDASFKNESEFEDNVIPWVGNVKLL